MAHRILFVFGDQDEALYKSIRSSLKKHLKSIDLDDIETDHALNYKRAWKCIEEIEGDGRHYDLIITHVHIHADEKTPLNPSEERGLTLLKNLSERKIPSILVSPAVNEEMVANTNLLHLCDPVPIQMENPTEQINALVIQKIKLLVTDSPAEKPLGKQVNLDIHIYQDERRCEMVCNDQIYPLSLNQRGIKKLLNRSDNVREFRNKYPQWRRALEDIGDDLKNEIFRDESVSAYFNELKGRVGGIENISIRFCVDRRTYPLILEALNEDESGKCDFWMLKTPICRTYGVREPQFKPLFEDQLSDDHTPNFLIIEPGVSGQAKEIDKSLEALENVPVETDKLEKIWEKLESKRLLGKIQPIRDNVTTDGVKSALLDGNTWHIVHFAGHSYVPDQYGDEAGSGYLALQKEAGNPNRIESLNIRRFSEWLRRAKTRFIYLSSCKSSNEKFIYELARNGIPAALGFRWDIKDRLAAEHAEHFYKNLFEHESLERAFLLTRKRMYNDHETHNIWAAPMLMLQCRQ